MDGHKPLCAAAMGSSTASTARAISRAGVSAESTGAAWRIKPGFRCRQSGRVGGSSANALSHQSSSSVSIQRIVSASDAPSLRKQSTARGTKRTESVLRPQTAEKRHVFKRGYGVLAYSKEIKQEKIALTIRFIFWTAAVRKDCSYMLRIPSMRA